MLVVPSLMEFSEPSKRYADGSSSCLLSVTLGQRVPLRCIYVLMQGTCLWARSVTPMWETESFRDLSDWLQMDSQSTGCVFTVERLAASFTGVC